MLLWNTYFSLSECCTNRGNITETSKRAVIAIEGKHILRAYAGAAELLQALRAQGRRVLLLSNAQAAFTVPELRKLGLLSLFDGIVISSDVGIKKPDKAIYEHILSQYGLRPETCLMIGNDAEADIQGAASAGIAGRYIHTNQSPDRQQPLPEGCLEIQHLRELL